MGVYTDWLIAEESEAKAIAEVGSSWDRWPSLSMKSILDAEMMCLYGILLGKMESEPEPQITDKQLFSVGLEVDDKGNTDFSDASSGAIVWRVVSDFTVKLADIAPGKESTIAEEWLKIGAFADWDDNWKAHVRDSLSKMIEFAQRSLKLKKPILELWAC